MPRTLPAGIAAEYTQPGSRPGYLIRIFLRTGITLRMTSLDTDYAYGGFTYTATDVTVPDLTFDGTIAPGAKLIFGDMAIALWTAARNHAFDDARVEIDAIYAAAAAAVVEFFRGRCGASQRAVATDGATFSLSLDAEATAQYAPRERVQYVIDSRWLLKSGAILTVNGQKWVIDRPKTSNA